MMTMKYKFILEDTNDDVSSYNYGPTRHIEHVITGEQTWPELLVHFKDWLHGVGYVFDGELDVVDIETGISAQDKLYKNE